jgi:hypothetical protein
MMVSSHSSGFEEVSTRSSRARFFEREDFLRGLRGQLKIMRGILTPNRLYCKVRSFRHVTCPCYGTQQRCQTTRVPGSGGAQHKRRHNFRRLISPSSEVTALLRLTFSTKLVKLCGVPLFRLRTVVWASPRTFFRFDLSSSNADIDFVLLKL